MIMEPAPILRVSRPVSACTRCKRTKIKCDGKLPACSACEKSGAGAECTGSTGEFARGKERSYVASLESRIAMLERKLAALDGAGGNSRMSISGTQTPSAQHAESLAFPASMAVQSAKKKAESAHVEDLVSDLGFITVNATSKGLYDFSQDMSFAKLILVASSRHARHVPSYAAAPLPPRHVAMQLVQYYLNTIFIQYPFFDEALLHISVNSAYQNERYATGPNLYMVYMILAISTLSQSRTKDAQVRATAASYVASAMEYAKLVIVPYSSIGIQALLLLLQYSLRDPTYYDPWYLIGVAARITIDLGLHQDTQKTGKTKTSDVELRRRLFYCVYAYDRYVSMTTERPYSFSDESINVRLPRMEGVPGADVKSGQAIPLAIAIETFRFSKLNSKWYQYLYYSESKPIRNPNEYLTARHDEMASWLDSLPANIDPFRRDWLKLEYHYMNVVLMSSDNPRIPQPSEMMCDATMENCINYVQTFQKLLTFMISNPRHPYSYTYYEIIRLHNVSQRYMDAICRSEARLFADRAKAQQGLLCISSIQTLLTFFASRYPEAVAFLDGFIQDSKVPNTKLVSYAGSYVVPPVSPEDTLRSVQAEIAYEWPNSELRNGASQSATSLS